LEKKLLSYLTDNAPIADPVDNFLGQLGDILRRLPYVKRRNFQLRILTLAAEVEDDSNNSNNR